MPLMYERVYRARSIGQVLHGALVELVRGTHLSGDGREIIGATFVVLQPTHALLIANKFKLSARMLYSRLFHEFAGLSFSNLIDHIAHAPLDAVVTVKSIANDLNFLPRNGILHLVVRPTRTKFSDLPYKLAIYAYVLVLVAKQARLTVGDLILAPLATQVSMDEMGELFNSVAPLVPWRGAELPLPTAPPEALIELASGAAAAMLERGSTHGASPFGWGPVVASLHNLATPARNETLDNLLAEGSILAWPRV